MSTATTMVALSGATVGRKRTPPKGRARTLQQKFARNLHRLAGDKTNREIAEACGVSNVSVSKWFSGHSMPEFELWPALAQSLGVNIRALLPPDIH